jgi:hypothetical protein
MALGRKHRHFELNRGHCWQSTPSPRTKVKKLAASGCYSPVYFVLQSCRTNDLGLVVDVKEIAFAVFLKLRRALSARQPSVGRVQISVIKRPVDRSAQDSLY